jgi:hypothetical protein
MPKKKHVWLLFDLNNGHEGSKRYVWWFDTKKQASDFKREHKTKPNAATLSAPTKAILSLAKWNNRTAYS